MNIRFHWKFILNILIVFNISNLFAFSFNLSDLNIVKNLMQQYLQTKFNSENPYKDQIAVVRKSSSISDEEKAAISNRLKVNNLALDKLLNINLSSDKNLRIGLCASGGGYRSAICTLGSLLGAQDIGLLDCITYMSGLSGSTWTMAAWLSLNKTLVDLKTQLSQNINSNVRIFGHEAILDIEHDQFSGIIEDIITKDVFDQPLCSVDIWGAAILDNLFYPYVNRQNLKLSEQSSIIKDGSMPFPIYTAIQPISRLNYQWHEFSPYECGNISENCYIPTWAFGRKFQNGKSLNNAPEQSLAFMLGMFGSAFDVTGQELVNKLEIASNFNKFLKCKFSFLPNVMLKKIIDIEESLSSLKNENCLYQHYCDDRLLPAHVCNFNYDHLNVAQNEQEDIILMDAGIDFNLPFPPLLRPERCMDVIIALDASSDIAGAPELMGAQNYANKKGLKFPTINLMGVDSSSLTVFGLENYPSTPVVIYMPRINSVYNMSDADITILKTKVDSKYYAVIDKLRTFDPEDCTVNLFCSTYNFAYSFEEFDLLEAMTYINMIINKEIIVDILKLTLAKKYMPYFKMPTSHWICR